MGVDTTEGFILYLNTHSHIYIHTLTHLTRTNQHPHQLTPHQITRHSITPHPHPLTLSFTFETLSMAIKTLLMKYFSTKNKDNAIYYHDYIF
jgi:hypothetical protein